MLFKNKKDGIYQIRLTEDNPYNEYMIIKTYGDTVKVRNQPSISCCRQQEEEWDEIYADIFPDYVGIKCPVILAEPTRPRINEYEIFDQQGQLVASGDSLALSQQFGVSKKRLSNSACSTHIFVKYILGKRYKFRVEKIN